MCEIPVPMAAKPDNDGVRKFLDSLPESVRKNVQSLRDVQTECDAVRAEHLKEKKALEEKYRLIYEPLFGKRKLLVVGDGGDATAAEPGVVPGFWLRVLKNPDMVGDHVTRRDEPILKYLMDIRNENLEDGAAGFKIIFEFAPNPYFKPLVLEKKYLMGGDDETVLEMTEGTKIEWTEGKNPGIKILTKKGKGGDPPVTKTIEKHSFFDFFSPPQYPAGDGEQAEEMTDIAELLAEDDFELGCYIKEVLVPSAVSWFTGELADEREEDDDYYEDEDEDSDEDEDDEDDD